MILTNKISKSISKKSKMVIKKNHSVHVDVNDGNFIKGWAASNNSKAKSLLVSISSKSDSVSLVANDYRPDVRRVGLHDTGLCGYQYDTSSWKDKNISVSVLGVVEHQSRSAFSPSFFIHIPKTAGTSFKRAAEKYFGQEGVVRNYGEKSAETTPWIKDTVLDNKDFPTLYRRLKQEGVGLYTGHLVSLPTVHVFPIKNVVTIMRRPMAQVLSHYHHYARWYGYEKSIEEFVKNPGFKNLQTRYLKGLPLQLIGFIGLTERYAESIDLYNTFSGFNLDVREDNINSQNASAEISNELASLIAEHNKDDDILYDQVVSLLNERLQLARSGKDWCFSFIDRLDDNIVAGVAYMALDDKPVTLVIKNNGGVIGRCTANGCRPGLMQFGVPNNGFIGFSFALPNKVSAADITVEVESTGQILQRKVII